MECHMKEEAPSFLPRLFVAPSCLPKFSMILETLAKKKEELMKKSIEVGETMDNKEHERLKTKCFWLRLEVNALESKAKKMRSQLVDRIYVEVRSVKEMKAVNELRLGTPCFQGKIYVSGDVPNDVIRAMVTVERSRQTFSIS